MSRRVIILGSTGSVGVQALDVIGARPNEFQIVALAAGGSDIESLADQIAHHRVQLVAISRVERADALEAALRERQISPLPKIVAGPDAAAQIAAEPADVVLNAITGAVGLEPTIAVLKAGTTLALANKESLIIGGELVTELAQPGQIVPVDSEHSALAQALKGEDIRDVRKLVVTASGGPFRGWTRSQLENVTPEQAGAHPTWDMGPVITINSATLMNKGLEVIEAHLLFGIDYEQIEVVVHPGSIVHSMVEFVDGSTMLQASPPDMRLPIALGLDWPRRVEGAASPCDWTDSTTWEFHPLDEETFPAVQLARKAGRFGRTAPAVYNAANEVCVDAFIANRISLPQIVDTVALILDEHLESAGSAPDAERLTIEAVLAADRWARERAQAVLDERE